MLLYSQSENKMISERRANFMRDDGWVQCQVCGNLHKVMIHNLSEEDLYIEAHCRKCRDDTKHLWIGQNKEDVYLYGNTFLDERYFIYKTIQND